MEYEPLSPPLLQEAWPAPPAGASAGEQQLSWPSYRKPEGTAHLTITEKNQKSGGQGKYLQ